MMQPAKAAISRISIAIVGLLRQLRQLSVYGAEVLMTLIPSDWQPPSSNAVAIFFLGLALLVAVSTNLDEKIIIALSSGLFGYANSK